MNLLRSTATVGGMTMLSRILGFARDILIATFLGTGPIADAWVMAFRLPNLFRRFFAEGAFNAAFVPLFSKRLEGEGPEAARRFAEESQAALAGALLIFSVAMIAFMPWAMILLAPGFLFGPGESFDLASAVARIAADEEPAKYRLTVELSRIAFPYLFFVSLVALLSGILNSVGKFFVAAAAPVLLNVFLIAALLVLTPFLESPGHALVWGVFAGGIAQFAALAWSVKRAGLLPRLRWPRLTPGVRRLIVLGIPGVIAGGITQINIVIGSLIASLQDGAPAILYYADRIYQLPLGLIGVAMGVVLLPDLSRRLRGGDEAGALESQNRALELSMLLTLPATVALMVIPLPIVITLFEHGAFDRQASQNTALALAAFAAGLPAYVLIKVFQPGFFAREDTATPMWFGLAQTVINVGLSIVLFFQIGFVGIAVATAAGAWVNVVLLAGELRRRKALGFDARVKKRLPLIALASAGLGIVLWAGQAVALPVLAAAALPVQIGMLALLVAGGMAAYALLVEMTGAARLRDLRGALRRRA